MRMTIVVAILLCTWSARADTGATERRAQAVQRSAAVATQAIAAGQPARALAQLKASLARSPGEAVLLAPYVELVLPLSQLGEPSAQAAQDVLRRVARAAAVPGDALVTHDPESERRVTLHAALAEAALGNFERAFARVVDAGQLQDPNTVLCLRQLAATALRSDQLELAEQALGLARQYMPQDPELTSELGRVLLARGKSSVAVTTLAERLASAPSSLSARADLAYAVAADGRAGEAYALLNRVSDECGRERSCALLAARLALEAERPEEAIRFARPFASAADPSAREAGRPSRDLDALFVLADAQLRIGDRAAARAAYELVLQQRPDSVRARQGLEQLGP